MSELKDLECSAWIERVRASALTIKDIKALKAGDTIKVLVLDRNVHDIVFQTNPIDVARRPEEFFRERCAVYVHKKDMAGEIEFGFGKMNFEFDLRLPECWYPLEEGYIPKQDSDKIFKFSYDEPQHWTKFPDSTLVGWRGPMVFWSKLSEMPRVYWTK